MKKFFFFVLILGSIISCKTQHINFLDTDLNAIIFYDFDNQPTSLNEIKKKWNERISKLENVEAQISKLEISEILDIQTNEKTLVLIGNTNKTHVKTATELTNYKGGLKLNETSVTCQNCNSQPNIGLNNGSWSCLGEKTENNPCTKSVTLRTK